METDGISHGCEVLVTGPHFADPVLPGPRAARLRTRLHYGEPIFGPVRMEAQQ
ncbi:hypothetical protein ACFV4P_15155 [Kitasatospora sp. NPDC059795]|uniref:hypothetical protein n=1 Tax=Kitasatospora sp. NPDC059795 TaxID=3346949 RepID=UPI003650F4F5